MFLRLKQFSELLSGELRFKSGFFNQLYELKSITHLWKDCRWVSIPTQSIPPRISIRVT